VGKVAAAAEAAASLPALKGGLVLQFPYQRAYQLTG
jgi:hypothetical protein